MAQIKTILVPIDFSECSKQAVRYALFLANQFDAKIDLLHVWEQPYYVDSQVMLYQERQPGQSILEYAKKQAEVEMEKFKAELPKDKEIEVLGRVSTGASYREILKIVDDESIDLIIMGTHGRKGLSHLLLGSVAEKVIRNAPCPVITIRSK